MFKSRQEGSEGISQVKDGRLMAEAERPEGGKATVTTRGASGWRGCWGPGEAGSRRLRLGLGFNF